MLGAFVSKALGRVGEKKNLLSPESNLTKIWKVSDGLDEEEEEVDDVEEDRERTMMMFLIGDNEIGVR